MVLHSCACDDDKTKQRKIKNHISVEHYIVHGGLNFIRRGESKFKESKAHGVTSVQAFGPLYKYRGRMRVKLACFKVRLGELRVLPKRSELWKAIFTAE